MNNIKVIDKRPRLVIEALFLRSKGNYGFREYFLNILNYLIEHSGDLKYSQVTIVTGERAIDVVPRTMPKNFTVYTLPVNNPIKVYFEQNRLAKRFKLTPNDVIMFTSDVAALVKSCKHLLVIHDWLYLRKEFAPGFCFRMQRRMFVPRGASVSDRIITISKWVKDDVLQHSKIAADRIIPIYNYLDFEKYTIGNISDYYYDFCNNNRYFLVVSSNARHKNLITLLRAYKIYFDSNPNSLKKKLVLVGSFQDEALVFLQAQRNDFKENIVQLNNVSNRDLGYLYENACAYISTTLFEGFGMPIAEAMYFGIPVVVSDIPVVREITDNKAIYFDPMDAVKLSELMLDSETLSVSEYAKRTVMAMFSQEETVAKYLEVLNLLSELPYNE